MSEIMGVPKDQFRPPSMLGLGPDLRERPANVEGESNKTVRGKPKRIRPVHRIMVMLAEQGWKQEEIARVLNYTQSRVSIILNANSPVLNQIKQETKDAVVANVQDIGMRFKMYSEEMLEIMVQHARASKPEVSRLAARDILHMAGYAPVKRSVNVEIPVPSEEVLRAAAHIQDANEVVLRRGEWEVHEKQRNTA